MQLLLSIAKMPNSEIAKRCRVCNDFTLVHWNFAGLSCQSCKKFFRRNACENKNFKCSKEGNCVITTETRKHCKFCRLNKCFLIGMRKDLILLNRTSPKNSPMQIKDENLIVEKFSNINLLDYEREKMEEVQKAMSIFCDEYSLELVGQAKKDDFTKVLNLPGLYVKKVINFAKSLKAFKCMKEFDQIKLLKAFYPRLSALHAAFIYKAETDGFPVIMNETHDKTVFVKLDIYSEITNENSIPIFREYTLKLSQKLENDLVIRDLVAAHLLFKHLDDVSCPEYIRYNSLLYCHLLERYFQEKCCIEEIAQKKYSALMEILSQMSPIIDIIRDVYANHYPNDGIVHVLAEIYDLI